MPGRLAAPIAMLNSVTPGFKLRATHRQKGDVMMDPAGLKSGDFVIWKKSDIGALCAYCRILDDGEWPGYWEHGTLADARAKATEVSSITGGRLHEISQAENPASPNTKLCTNEDHPCDGTRKSADPSRFVTVPTRDVG